MKFTKNWKKANLLTHAGKFHADELFASVILDHIHKNPTLTRVQSIPADLDQNKYFIYDIGYGDFDHHQKGGNGVRKDGTKYAACGLVWQKFGITLLKNFLKTHYKLLNVKSYREIEEETIQELHTRIDENFIKKIDSDDNGQLPYLFSDAINLFNPAWNEKVDPDASFKEAYAVAKSFFDRILIRATSDLAAKKIIETALKTAENHVLILDQYITVEPTIFEIKHPKAKDIYYIIYPSNRSGYNIRAISVAPGEFTCRKPFPKSWAGLSGKDLQAVTGVETASFCHNSRFLTVTDTLEDAQKIAALAVSAKSD